MLLLIAILSLAGLTLGSGSALAANQTVTATASDTFVEKNVTIAPGEMVTWTNTGGLHNVHFDDNSFDMPADPVPPPWSVSRTFGQAGTYRYYCEAHGAAGGVGMAGTVMVSSGGGGGSPPPSPQPGPSPGDAKPVSSLAAPATQDVDRLHVKASINEAGSLTATGSVTVPRGAAKVYRFKPVTRKVSANVVVKLRLKLSKRSLKTVKRALAHRRLRAKVTVTARDRGGNETIRRRTIRLKR